jgi:hypothetical protein
MIDWNTSNTKPAVDTEDNFRNFHKQSAKVLVRILDRNNKFCGYAFATYHYNSDDWVIEGFLGDFTVSHWSSLNEPSTACFSPVDLNENKE